MINIDFLNIPFKMENHSKIIFEKYLEILNPRTYFTSDKCEFCDSYFYRSGSSCKKDYLDVRTYTDMNKPQ